MQIVVPMSGFGERFRRAGYLMPKPLLEVEGKPIIAHVIDMFPGENNFIFICNKEHLNETSYQMEAILNKYAPTGRVVGIAPHKLGPIHAIQQAQHLLEPNEPVIVNYCDFTCYWDWSHFKHFVTVTKCVGAIPAYRGFHPHSLGSTNYAYLREANGWVKDIQEKRPYTSNRMLEYASSGTYYFATAQTMIEAFNSAKKQDLNVAGEFYVSLAYKPLLANKKPIAVYPIQHFMQWGTPEDITDYNTWSKAFNQLALATNSSLKPSGALIMPMAGLGQRFISEGYEHTKPLIPVSGKSMVAQATDDLPPTDQHSFVLRADMNGYNDVVSELIQLYPNAIFSTVDQVTDGQACTALIGLKALTNNTSDDIGLITIGACDTGVIYNHGTFLSLISNPEIDVIVWGTRGYTNSIRNPSMFGWVDEENGRIKSVSVKATLCNPNVDPIVIGTFTFRRASDFHRAVEKLIARGGKINGEYYIDSCINDAIDLGLRCQLFEVDSYLCWGTPNDLRTFEYWQSCFHKWHSHPYQLSLDKRVPCDQLKLLEERYRATLPSLPDDFTSLGQS